MDQQGCHFQRKWPLNCVGMQHILSWLWSQQDFRLLRAHSTNRSAISEVLLTQDNHVLHLMEGVSIPAWIGGGDFESPSSLDAQFGYIFINSVCTFLLNSLTKWWKVEKISLSKAAVTWRLAKKIPLSGQRPPSQIHEEHMSTWGLNVTHSLCNREF